MPRGLEELRQVFDHGLIIPVIEQRVGPLETLIATGSITKDSELDVRGTSTSDVDYIAIIAKNFKGKSIPKWQMAPKRDNALEAKGTIQGRTVHLRTFSHQRVNEILNFVLENLDKPLQELNMPLWVLAREMAEGVIIHGSLPDHQFFGLYNNPPAGSHMDTLKGVFPIYFS